MTKLTAGALARRAFANDVSNWLRSDPLARDGTDPEGVHQLRVTSRRLRAEIDVLGASLDPVRARRMTKRLKWIGSILGRSRDLDVLFDLLSSLQHADAPFDASVLARLQRQRAQERRRVDGALASDAYERLMRELASWAIAPPLGRRAGRSAQRLLRPGVISGLEDLFRHVDDLGPRPPDEALHHLRITIKRVRYRCEVAAPALGGDAAELAKELARSQGVLGDLHDRAVALDFLEHWRTSRWAADDTASHHVGVDVAVDTLHAQMVDLRRKWRAPLSRARRRSSSLFLPDRDAAP